MRIETVDLVLSHSSPLALRTRFTGFTHAHEQDTARLCPVMSSVSYQLLSCLERGTCLPFLCMHRSAVSCLPVYSEMSSERAFWMGYRTALFNVLIAGKCRACVRVICHSLPQNAGQLIGLTMAAYCKCTQCCHNVELVKLTLARSFLGRDTVSPR